MKLYIVLLVICVVAVQAKPHHDGPSSIRTAAQKCAKEAGLNEQQIREHFKNGPTEKEDCFQACIYKDLGVLDDNNELHKEKALEFTHPNVKEEDKQKIADTCLEKKGANPCETAVLVHKCVKELIPPPPKDAEKENAKKVCQGKLEVSDDFVEKWHDGEDLPKEDCFGACVIKELGIVNADGSFNIKRAAEKIPPHLPKEDFEKAAEVCKDKKGANDCETAVVIRKCMREQLDEGH